MRRRLAGSESTDSSRAACCAAAPGRRDGLVAQGLLGGSLRGRLVLSDCMVAEALIPVKIAASAWPWGRFAFARSNNSNLVLYDLSSSGYN